MHRSGVRPSVCPIFLLTLIGRAAHTQRDSPGATGDAASVHFGPTVRRTDIIVTVAVKRVGLIVSVAASLCLVPCRRVGVIGYVVMSLQPAGLAVSQTCLALVYVPFSADPGQYQCMAGR